MPIPDFDRNTGYLPAGDHPALLEELEERCCWNPKRKELFAGLKEVVNRLRSAGVDQIWVGGSFPTDKRRPADVDVVYQAPKSLSSAALGELSSRDAVKAKYHVDLWRMPALQLGPTATRPLISIKEFFETDRNDCPRGLVELKEEPGPR